MNVNKNKGLPQRSGIGINTNEWEAPKRLQSSIQKFGSSNSNHDRSDSVHSNNTKTTKETSSIYGPGSIRSSDEVSLSGYSRSSRVLGDVFDDNASVYSEATQATQDTTYTSRSNMSLTSNAMHRAGYNVTENKSLDDFNYNNDTTNKFDRNEDDEEFDRDFYLSEESGLTIGQDGHNDNENGPFLGSQKKFQEREEQMAKSRAKGDTKIAGMSAKRSQLHADQSAWEENRLLQSGVAIMDRVQTEFDNEEDSRVNLIVHNLKPPFLDGRVSFSVQQSMVSIVKDPTSDFATNARNGSQLLKDVREKRDQAKMRKRFWELGM